MPLAEVKDLVSEEREQRTEEESLPGCRGRYRRRSTAYALAAPTPYAQ
jgi:hypothetical protein